MTFVELFGTDPFMRTIPPEFSRYRTGEDAFHHTSWQEACFMGFLEWLQRPPKPIAPASASNYLYICSEAPSHLPWSRYDQSDFGGRSFQAEEGEHEHLLDG